MNRDGCLCKGSFFFTMFNGRDRSVLSHSSTYCLVLEAVAKLGLAHYVAFLRA